MAAYRLLSLSKERAAPLLAACLPWTPFLALAAPVSGSTLASEPDANRLRPGESKRENPVPLRLRRVHQ